MKEALPAPDPIVWQNVQKWLGQIEFKDFVNDKPENDQKTEKELR